LAPQQYRLYPQLDEIYAELGDPARRSKLYAGAPPFVLARDVVRVRQASFLVEQRHFDEALAVLLSHSFKPWEGGQITREVYVVANLQLGRQELSRKEYAKAEQSFRRALEYPVTLGVGKPSRPHDEEAQYWLGETLNAEGETDAARAAWRSAAAAGSGAEGNSALFRAVAEQRLGDTRSAQEKLTHLVELANTAQASAQDFCIAGRAQHFLGKEPLAQYDFRKALTVDPNNLCARMELTAVAESSKAVGVNH
jgi:tetratricopeptide (TPR) repeat protein